MSASARRCKPKDNAAGADFVQRRAFAQNYIASKRGLFTAALCSAVVLATASSAFSQDYPNKPIRIITGPVAGSNDFTSRLIAQGITGALGQQVVVDNRPGVIAVETVVKAPADGYTLLIYGSPVWMEPLLRDHVSWDPFRDLTPITLANTAVNVLVVHPSVAVKSVKELIALAKANPGKLDYASGETGAANHLAGELFKSMAGVNIVRVPYKATGTAVSDLIAGQVEVMFINAGALAPNLKTGKLKPLAVTSVERSLLFPDLPTLARSGLPGYELVSRTGVFSPAKTSPPIVNRLNQEIVRFLKTQDAKERFLSLMLEPDGSSPEQLTSGIKNEVTRLGKLIKDLGIRAE